MIPEFLFKTFSIKKVTENIVMIKITRRNLLMVLFMVLCCCHWPAAPALISSLGPLITLDVTFGPGARKSHLVLIWSLPKPFASIAASFFKEFL